MGNVFSYNKTVKTLPKKNPRAFTLIELLIVMVLLAILGTISFEGIVNARNHARLKNVTNTVVGMIQTARSYALSSMEMDLGADGICEATYYYVSFDTDSTPDVIYLYAYLDVDGDDCGTADASYELDSVEIYEDILITAAPDFISYEAPLADVGIDPVPVPASDPTQIELQTFDGTFTKTIEVYLVSGFPELVD